MPYKNDHPSFSRLSRFEQCPLSFQLHYIEEKRADPNDWLRFGRSIRYKMFNTTKVAHPLDETVWILGDATGRSKEELTRRIATVDNKALEAVLKELGKEMERPRVTLLKAELDARARKSFSPRFWAKAVQS